MEHDGAHDDAAPWFQRFKKEEMTFCKSKQK